MADPNVETLDAALAKALELQLQQMSSDWHSPTTPAIEDGIQELATLRSGREDIPDQSYNSDESEDISGLASPSFPQSPNPKSYHITRPTQLTERQDSPVLKSSETITGCTIAINRDSNAIGTNAGMSQRIPSSMPTYSVRTPVVTPSVVVSPPVPSLAHKDYQTSTLPSRIVTSTGSTLGTRSPLAPATIKTSDTKGSAVAPTQMAGHTVTSTKVDQSSSVLPMNIAAMPSYKTTSQASEIYQSLEVNTSQPEERASTGTYDSIGRRTNPNNNNPLSALTQITSNTSVTVVTPPAAILSPAICSTSAGDSAAAGFTTGEQAIPKANKRAEGRKKRTNNDFVTSDMEKQLAACRAQIILLEDKNNELESTISTLKRTIATRSACENIQNDMWCKPCSGHPQHPTTFEQNQIDNIKIRIDLLELKMEQKILELQQRFFPSRAENDRDKITRSNQNQLNNSKDSFLCNGCKGNTRKRPTTTPIEAEIQKPKKPARSHRHNHHNPQIRTKKQTLSPPTRYTNQMSQKLPSSYQKYRTAGQVTPTGTQTRGNITAARHQHPDPLYLYQTQPPNLQITRSNLQAPPTMPHSVLHYPVPIIQPTEHPITINGRTNQACQDNFMFTKTTPRGTDQQMIYQNIVPPQLQGPALQLPEPQRSSHRVQIPNYPPPKIESNTQKRSMTNQGPGISPHTTIDLTNEDAGNHPVHLTSLRPETQPKQLETRQCLQVNHVLPHPDPEINAIHQKREPWCATPTQLRSPVLTPNRTMLPPVNQTPNQALSQTRQHPQTRAQSPVRCQDPSSDRRDVLATPHNMTTTAAVNHLLYMEPTSVTSGRAAFTPPLHIQPKIVNIISRNNPHF